MKTVVSFSLVVALICAIVPKSSGDLPNYNDGTTGTINVGTINVRTNVNAAAGAFTNSLTLNGSSVLTNAASSNWNASGTTNSTLVGNALINQVTSTNGVVIPNTASLWTDTGTSRLSMEGSGSMLNARISGSSCGAFVVLTAGNGFQVTSGNYLGWSGSSTPNAAADLVMTRDGSATWQLGFDAASVVTPQTIKSCDATGTDHNGASLQLQGGQSTGAGVPGDLIYRTSLYTNGSGSTANAYTTRGQIIGRPCALTNATATSFQRFTMATNTQAGIRLFCTVKATDAAFARQSISSDVRVDAVNVNGTITATVSETDNTLAASTGTLTIAYTVVDEGSNVLAIRANANTSLTATPSIKWIIQSINSDGAITVTPVQL